MASMPASVGETVVQFRRGEKTTVTVPLDAAGRAALAGGGTALVSWAPGSGGTQSLAAPLP